MPASQNADLEQGEETQNLHEAQGRHISVTTFLWTVPTILRRHDTHRIIFRAPKDTPTLFTVFG